MCDCGSVYASACVRLQAFASEGTQSAGVEEATQVSSPVPRRSRVWELLLRGPSRRPSCCLTWSLLWLRPTLWVLDSTQTCAPAVPRWRGSSQSTPQPLPSSSKANACPAPRPFQRVRYWQWNNLGLQSCLLCLGFFFFFFLSLSFSTCNWGGGVTDLHRRFAVRIKVKHGRMLSEYSRLPAPSIC